MTPSEVYVYLDAFREPERYGSMTQEDVEELIAMREKNKELIWL